MIHWFFKFSTALTFGAFSSYAFSASQIRTLLQENRSEEALNICRQFESLSSYESDNLFACAWVYYRTGRNSSAEKIVERLKNKYSLPEYQLLLSYGALLKKNYTEAKQLMDQVASDNKGTTIGLTAQELQGENYEAQGQLSVAAFIYKQVVSEDPNRGWSHWGLGRYYLAQGENQRAVKELEMTAKLWPKHIGSRFNLAVIALSENNLSNALRWLTECYQLNKADAGVLEQLGLLFEKQGRISSAVNYWQRALALNKNSTVAKEKLAKYTDQVLDQLIDSGKYSEALAKLKTMTVSASEPLMLLKRGIVYRNLKNYEKASIDLKAYLKSNPSDGRAMRELGICYLNLKLLNEARTYFEKSISVEPDNGYNHAWLAWALEAQKNYRGAENAWRQAINHFKDPKEIKKASRRLSSIEKKHNKIGGSKKLKDKGMDMGVGQDPLRDVEEGND